MKIRKLVLLICSLIFQLITIISVSYAFITNNLQAYVTGIEINVELTSGLAVSTNGQTFSSNLTQNQIKEAIVVKYLGYSYSSDGTIVDKTLNRVEDFTQDLVDTKFAEIVLKPVTTNDARNFYIDKNNYKSSSTMYRTTNVEEGRYISFDLYFKALDNSVNVFYSASNYNYDESGNRIKKFSIQGENITSSLDETSTSYLHNNLITMDSQGNALTINGGTNELTFNPGDAIRFSSYVEKYESETSEDGSVTYTDALKIYELNYGLGSYATTLDSSYYDSNYLDASRYDASKNAQQTYRLYSSDYTEAKYRAGTPNYNSLPYTYKGFDTYESANLLTLDSKDDVKKATFTFWIEGWDADCFDGLISNNVSINMAFTTNISAYYEQLKTVNYHYGENNETVKTLHYFDINSQLLKDIYLPSYYSDDDKVLESLKDKKFKGWYLENSDKEFDFNVLYNTLETTFDLYAKWE